MPTAQRRLMMTRTRRRREGREGHRAATMTVSPEETPRTSRPMPS